MDIIRAGLMAWLVALPAMAACKDRASSKPGGAPAVAAGSAAAPSDAGVADAGSAGGLVFDDGDDGLGTVFAFGKQAPRLPAISRDGTQIAIYEPHGDGSMTPVPFDVELRPLGAAGNPEVLPIIDDQMASDAATASWTEHPPAPAVARLLQSRAAAAIARLRGGGFASLVAVDVPGTSSSEPQPVKVGEATLELASVEDPKDTITHLDVVLRDADGAVVRRERIAGYHDGTFDSGVGQVACNYRPVFRAAYVDPRHREIYVQTGFHWHELCDPTSTQFLVWDLPASVPSQELAAIRALVAAQFEPGIAEPDPFTADAQLIHVNGIAGPHNPTFRIAERDEQYIHHVDAHPQITLARDGATAWASLTTKLAILPRNQPGRDDPWRASDVLVKTPAGWKIAAMVWSTPTANAVVNREARAGKRPALDPLDGAPGDRALLDAFGALVRDGVDAAAEARADLIAIGSGPGERTVGGKLFAAGWNAGWRGKLKVVSQLARRAPSGTTGWVVANVQLAKPGYEIPFQIFCVFDQTATGAWTLVHVHFAV